MAVKSKKATKATKTRKPKKESSKCTIKDPVIEPYFIEKTERQYVLMEKGSILPKGYYNSLETVLKGVIDLLIVNKGGSRILSLRKYIEEYRELTEEIKLKIQI